MYSYIPRAAHSKRVSHQSTRRRVNAVRGGALSRESRSTGTRAGHLRRLPINVKQGVLSILPTNSLGSNFQLNKLPHFRAVLYCSAINTHKLRCQSVRLRFQCVAPYSNLTLASRCRGQYSVVLHKSQVEVLALSWRFTARE